jgi:hypothetical protein
MSLRTHDADVRLIGGKPKRWSRSADSGDLVICYFCGTCGTRLWHEPAGSGFLHIKPGTLDDPSQLAPRFEAWTKRKASLLTIEGLEASFETQPWSEPKDREARSRMQSDSRLGEIGDLYVLPSAQKERNRGGSDRRCQGEMPNCGCSAVSVVIDEGGDFLAC